MSKIKLTYDEKEYELEYSRQSVKTMESRGFVLDEISSKPMTMIPLLFEGAFIKNCPGVKRKVMDEIYDGIGDKTGFIQALAELYAETLSTLTDSTGEGNVSWAMTR
jgi:hypothetical protein